MLDIYLDLLFCIYMRVHLGLWSCAVWMKCKALDVFAASVFFVGSCILECSECVYSSGFRSLCQPRGVHEAGFFSGECVVSKGMWRWIHWIYRWAWWNLDSPNSSFYPKVILVPPVICMWPFIDEWGMEMFNVWVHCKWILLPVIFPELGGFHVSGHYKHSGTTEVIYIPLIIFRTVFLNACVDYDCLFML